MHKYDRQTDRPWNGNTDRSRHNRLSVMSHKNRYHNQNTIDSHRELVRYMMHIAVKTANSSLVHSTVECLAQRNSEFQAVHYSACRQSAPDATDVPTPLSPAANGKTRYRKGANFPVTAGWQSLSLECSKLFFFCKLLLQTAKELLPH